MVDINFSNKTLAFFVLIALILSYGMVNFDRGGSSAQPTRVTVSKTQVEPKTEQKIAKATPSSDSGIYYNSRRDLKSE